MAYKPFIEALRFKRIMLIILLTWKEVKLWDYRRTFKLLTHLCLGVPPAIIVWNNDTFNYNYRIENDFTKYFKESC